MVWVSEGMLDGEEGRMEMGVVVRGDVRRIKGYQGCIKFVVVEKCWRRYFCRWDGGRTVKIAKGIEEGGII